MAELVIRQFDVTANPDPDTSAQAPYVVVLQSHLFKALDTTIVAPLFRPGIVAADALIALDVAVLDEAMVLDVALLTNIESRLLRGVVANLRDYDYAIQRALDRLFTGF